MGPGHFLGGGMWGFPIFMPIIMLIFCLAIIYLIFGRGRLWNSRRNDDKKNIGDSETALEILKKRYARGEITKEEFDRMRKDIT